MQAGNQPADPPGIVGQLFDYASRSWRTDVSDFEVRWQNRTGQAPCAAGPDGTALRETVAANLQEGRFRIVLAVDAIYESLKRMTEYLNEMSGLGTQIIAVEYVRLTKGSTESFQP